MAEEITYDQIDTNGPGPGDPLGLRKKLQSGSVTIKPTEDALGLRAQLNSIKQPTHQPEQPTFQLSEPTLRAIPRESAVVPSAPNEKINISQGEVKYIPDEKTYELQKQQGKAKVAHEKVNTALAGNDAQYEKKLRESRRDNYTVESLRNDYKQKGIILSPQDEQKALQKEKERQYNLPVTNDELTDFKTGTILTPKLSRKFIKDLNDKDVAESAYRVDKFNELANDPDPNAHKRIEKINEVATGIKKGTYVYDPETRAVVQPMGTVGSIIEGVKNKFKADEEHDFLKNTSNDAAVVMELENERNNPDVDQPIKVPRGRLNEALNTIAEMPITPIVAGVAGTIGGTFVGNPELGTVAAASLGAYENRKAQYTSTFKQVYNELRDQGKPEFDALSEARKQAENAQEIGTVVGAAQGLVGAKIGEIPIKGTTFSLGYQKAVGQFLKNNGVELGKIALDAAAQGGLGAAGEIAKNKLAQAAGIKRDWDAGAADSFYGNAIMAGGIGAALKLGRGLSKINYKTILNGLTKSVPEEAINSALQEKVASGEITQDAANQALNEIKEYKAKDAQIPPNVTEEARFKIQDNIDKINELEQQKEQTHKSLQGPIKEQIDKLVDENLALSKETVKAEKSASGLSKDKEKEAVDFAHELADEGILPDTYAPEAKKDPIKFWQTIAQQAQNRDENWKPLTNTIDEQSVRDNYGDTVVDYAKELFPAPEVMGSKISVIRPGEIRQPEVTTISGAGKVPAEEIGHVEVSEHGEDAKTAAGKENGIGPSPLTEDGMKEAKELGKYIAENNKSKIITSEVERGLQTAEEAAKEAKRITGKEVPIERNELLNTANIGSDEGKPEGTFKEKEWFEGKYMPDGAESPDSFKTRMEKAYEYVKSLPEDTHVVSHSKVMRALDALSKTDGKWTDETTNIFLQNKELTHAQDVRGNQGQLPEIGEIGRGGQEIGSHDIQQVSPEPSISGETEQQAGIGAEEGKDTGKEGVGRPPVGASEGKGVYVEHPETQLSFRGLQETANEFGFEDVKSRDRVSDLQERKNAETTTKQWAEKGEYQKNIDDLLDRIDKRELVPTAKQRLILEQYLANEKQKLREMPKNSSEYDSQLAKVKRIKDIGTIARQEAGAALRLPDSGTLPHPILDEADAMAAKMEANAVDKLTDQQKAEVESQVEKYRQASEEANKKIADLEEQVAKLDAQKELDKTKSTAKRASKKTASERLAFRRSEIEAAREALRKLRSGESGLSAVPLPGVRELIAIAPHVKNLMVDLVAQGVDNLQDVISHLHAEFKDVLEGLTEKNIHDIIAGEYNEKGKSLSELQRQIKDLRDEAKYINQLESLLNGKEPKAERAKIERNQKIKDLKEKIKSFKQEVKESEKFYGESNVGEEKLDKLRDELDRIQERRKKESPVKGSTADKEISQREQDLRDKIKEAQDEWDKEKDAAKQRDRDYARMESERNRQLQRVSDLKEKLENLQNGIKAKGKGAVKKADTPEIEALKTQVADAEKELNKTIATEKRVKGLEEELDRLKQRKEKEPKEVNKREISDKEAELKRQIEEERKSFNKEKSEASKFYKEELDDDAKKLIAIKKRNQKLEQQIKEKIANGQFEKETKTSIFDREDVKKNYPRLRKDALDAIAQKEEAQHEFDLALFNDEMKRRKWYQKAVGFGGKLIHTSKAIMSGIDDSATFVQNGLAMLANPKLGAKAWWDHAKDAFSNERFKRELAAIHQRPDWEIIKKSGLEIVEPHSIASKQVEEAFEQNLLANLEIKGVKPWDYTGGVFERAFTSMGNNMRLLLFEKRMNALAEEGMTFESHPEEYKSAARVINELTGRGKLPAGLAQASPYITPFIWAPRMLASTLNILGLGEIRGLGGKGYYQNLTPMQRRFALGQLGRGVGIGIAVMGAAALGGARVDYDPRSVTFGDIIWGDHHYNIFGRFTPVVKVLVQAGMGVRIKGSGVQQDLDSGKFGAKTRTDVVFGFFRGKTTPAVGTALNLMEGRNYFTNEKFTLKDVPGALLQPMSIKELRDGWNNDGSMTILNRFLPAFEGMKTSDERDFNKKGGSGGGAGATGTIGHKTVKHKTSHSTHKTR